MCADGRSPLPQRRRPDSTATAMLPFFVRLILKTPLTPVPLSVCNLQSHPATDIEIDIKTVEKLIGEIIAQPLR